METYIAYYRVSTKEQGISNLGIEAQKRTVELFCKNGKIIHCYTEIESGKNNKRVKLSAAINECKQTGATLVISKLDRLSRNLAFVTSLMESQIKFQACDMPTANELTIAIFAAIAQNEVKLISERTKSALQSLKLRGVKLGNPNTPKGSKEAKAAGTFAQLSRTYKKPDPMLLSLILSLYKQGLKQTQIRAHLLSKTGTYISKSTVSQYIIKYANIDY